MRILVANDCYDNSGGVQTYIDEVVQGLIRRGHELLMFYRHSRPEGATGPLTHLQYISITESGMEGALEQVASWHPTLAYSQNMSDLDLEVRLLDRYPMVKFMHGYFGTCASGLKMHAWPRPVPCDRRFGPACLALYFPRRCGRLGIGPLVDGYRWSSRQAALFGRYRAVVVGSEHMGREYRQNGVPAERVHVNPLFGTAESRADLLPLGRLKSNNRVLFLGRMTKLKGGDLLIRAVAKAGAALSRMPLLVMAGDGPQRSAWQGLAARLGVPSRFTGWINAGRRAEEIEGADLLAIPSLWPEPFGLVGLEAAAAGVPAVGFDVGGIRQWLDDGVTGFLAPGDPPTVTGLAKALATALSSSEKLRAAGVAAREKAASLSLAAHLDRLERIFEASLQVS